MYEHVSREDIADTLMHLRRLFREIKPSNEKELRAQEKREVITKNLLSNLFRMKEHPTLQIVLEIAEIFSLTLDGAHRMFGYRLEGIREYDFQLNGGMTHIVESYPFERDLLVDLPGQLGTDEAFEWDAPLRDLVSHWQVGAPIRSLEEPGWQRHGAFYVRVGTEDSLGSSLPPGATALVEPISDEDRVRPNPRATYLLQFANGYRCSRCVVTGNKLLLLNTGRNYDGPQEFSYPGSVRIAGKVRMFALELPMPEYPALRTLPRSSSGGRLILPWEHGSLDQLFTAKYHRFQQFRDDLPGVWQGLEAIFHSRLSSRTERRYRSPTASQPHVDVLIKLALANLARYTDCIRTISSIRSDRGRYSLETLLGARHWDDLPAVSPKAHLPVPRERWAALREEYVEWPTLLSVRFPDLGRWQNQVVRFPKGSAIRGIDPPISAGSIMLLDTRAEVPDTRYDARKSGWSRPIYALRRGVGFLCGHVELDGDQYALLSNGNGNSSPIRFSRDELSQLSRVSSIAVPV